jgi:RNA polymerase sigma-70 factor (ECF subfamily)
LTVTDASDRDDRELVARFLRGRDESCFRTIYRRHTPALYALSLRLLQHRTADAEDAVQDTWIRAVARLESFRWGSTLRTWLCGILVNCCRERQRAAWRFNDVEDESEAADPSTPPLELTLEVDRALATLPAGCRGVFVLHDVEGRTHEEIGVMLGISSGTSKSQLFHARRRLRTLLQQGL